MTKIVTNQGIYLGEYIESVPVDLLFLAGVGMLFLLLEANKLLGCISP